MCACAQHVWNSVTHFLLTAHWIFRPLKVFVCSRKEKNWAIIKFWFFHFQWKCTDQHVCYIVCALVANTGHIHRNQIYDGDDDHEINCTTTCHLPYLSSSLQSNEFVVDSLIPFDTQESTEICQTNRTINKKNKWKIKRLWEDHFVGLSWKCNLQHKKINGFVSISAFSLLVGVCLFMFSFHMKHGH